jgi:predicted nucleic acid-binding protein
MSFLLDTNVISEWVKPQPHRGVIRWLVEADEDRVFISVISIAEIRRGLERIAKGRRRERIAAWLREDLPVRFEGRILPVDLVIAHEWGVAIERARRRGIVLSVMDAFLAATARTRELTLVTRNTKDFQDLGLSLFDPWATDKAGASDE